MKNIIKALILLILFSGNNLMAEEKKSLTELLKERASSVKIPSEKKRIMKSAIDELSISEIEEKAIKVGDKIPDFNLKNFKNEDVSLYENLKEGPVVLTFYRGGWCPYCNIQLHFYQKNLSEFKKYNAKLIAISPETPDNSVETVKKNKIEYQVVSDLNNEYAKKLGLVFDLNDDLIKLYKSFGINLEDNQKNKDWQLPLSATFVINQKGIITYSFINVNYKFRADVSDITSALKDISNK